MFDIIDRKDVKVKTTKEGLVIYTSHIDEESNIVTISVGTTDKNNISNGY